MIRTASRLMLAACCAAVLAFAAAAPAYGGFPGGTGRFLYTASTNDPYGDIYDFDPATGTSRDLTNTSGVYDSNGTYSPDGTKIAFWSNRAGLGHCEIYVMNADGSNVVQVTHGSTNCDYTSPAWSPDGTKLLAAVRRNDNGDTSIDVMNADGSNETVLAPVQAGYYKGSPVWSPDGTKIAFQSNYGESSDISVMNADGSDPTNLTCCGAHFYYGPNWAPDSSQLVFAQGESAYGEGTPLAGIYKMNADGTDFRPLLTHPGCPTASSPVWSPSGSQIAFSLRTGPADGCGGGSQTDIYVMNADGTNRQDVTNTSNVDETLTDWQPIPGGSVDVPPGSPPATTLRLVQGFDVAADGTKAMTGVLASDPDAGQTDVFEAPPGGGLTSLTFDSANEGVPSIADNHQVVYSPDGTRIVLRNGDGSGRVALTQTYYNCGVNSPAIAPDASVVVYTNGCDQGRLHRVNTDGSGDTPLTPPDYFMTSAAFSDDGAKIAAYCYSFSTNAYGICTMNADGTNVQLVLPSTDTQQWDQPSWSPDGDRLAVAGYANGEAQIFVAGSDGSSPQQVTSDGTDNIQPRWLPDGDIAYIHYNPDNTSDIRVTSPDTTAPTVNCGSADGSWHGDDVTIACTASDDGSGLADPADTSFGLSTTVPAGTETASAATGTHQVCDRAGNCTTAGPIDGNEIDKKAPQVTCGAADGVWHAVDVSIGCTATDGGSGLASSGDASFSLSTNVPAGTETSTAQTNTHVVQDQVGNSVTAGPIGGNQIDKKAPQVTCGAADGVWHAVNVSIACTATDGGSGLASSGDASFSLSTNVPAGTETATAQTNSRVVQDQVGNSAPAGPIPGNKIDRKAPTITVTTPPQNVNYVFRQPVAANYACTDPGSGVQSCTGTVANGANIPTSTPGAQTFTVTARDNVGNVAPTVTRNYTVTFTFQGFSYPQNQPVINVVQSGRITPARFNLVDYFGTTIYNTYGLNIFVGGSPSSGGITCPTGTTYNATQTASAGLRYDTTNRRYEYGFTTSTAWAGTCRVLTLKFRDGAQQKLTYKFR